MTVWLASPNFNDRINLIYGIFRPRIKRNCLQSEREIETVKPAPWIPYILIENIPFWCFQMKNEILEIFRCRFAYEAFGFTLVHSSLHFRIFFSVNTLDLKLILVCTLCCVSLSLPINLPKYTFCRLNLKLNFEFLGI